MTRSLPVKTPAMTGQSSMSLPWGRLTGENREARGIMILAPAARAALPSPLISKQLSGSFMGLSVTSTWAAPALTQRPATAASTSGWVVAPKEGGVAKAALTLMSTRSPFWTKDSIPSQGLNPPRQHQRPVRAPDDGHFSWSRGFAAEGVIPQTGQHLLCRGRGRTFGVIKGQSAAPGSQGHHRGVPQPFQKIPAVHAGCEQTFFILGLLHGFFLEGGAQFSRQDPGLPQPRRRHARPP